MKHFATTTAFVLLQFITNAQSNNFFLRHDTAILEASSCNWLIPPGTLSPRSPNTVPIVVVSADNTVIEWFLTALKKGKLKGFDPNSEKLIPAGQIYTWGMQADTVVQYDVNMQPVYAVVVNEIRPEQIDRIRVQQDWWLDQSSGKIYSKVRWIELLLKVYNMSGTYVAYRPFCRIYY